MAAPVHAADPLPALPFAQVMQEMSNIASAYTAGKPLPQVCMLRVSCLFVFFAWWVSRRSLAPRPPCVGGSPAAQDTMDGCASDEWADDDD